MTIYTKLAQRLGRTPTNVELKAEIERIKTEGLVEMAEKGRLSLQRKR